MKASVRIATAAALVALASAVGVPLASQQQSAPDASTRSAPASQTPATPPAAPEAGRPGGGGRGGGRGNQMAALYTERCAACHGTETAAGRAPNLFDDQWTRAKDDIGIAAASLTACPRRRWCRSRLS